MHISRGWTLAAALATLLGVGCRVLSTSPSPAAAQENAGAVRVGMLAVDADFPLPASHRLLRELVALRGDMSQRLGLATSEEVIHVRLFRDGASYAQFMRDGFPEVPARRAFFVETDTRLSVYAHWSERVAEDLRHEVAHGYLHASVGDLPLWLDEGLAEFYEVPRASAGLNAPHVDLLADLIDYHQWQPNLQRLEALAHCGEMNQTDYAESWAWVHLLLETQPSHLELLRAHLAEIREDGTAEPLSVRLSHRLHQPERTLVEHILSLLD